MLERNHIAFAQSTKYASGRLNGKARESFRTSPHAPVAVPSRTDFTLSPGPDARNVDDDTSFAEDEQL